MNKKEIEKYLRMVGGELQNKGLTVKILLLGGAVMVLEVGNRDSTSDIDAYFASNYSAVYHAVTIVAQREGLSSEWLNDDAAIVVHQVKPPQSQRLWKAFPGLQVYIPSLDYMLALKLHAGRARDDRDIKALARQLNISTRSAALGIVKRYIPEDHVKDETLMAIIRCFKR